SVSDVDVSDNLTLSAPTLPSWLSFDSSAGVLSGTPTNTEVGSHSVVLRVNDGSVDVDQSFSITVSNTNDAPVITSSEITSATEDSAYSYTFSASDVDVSDSLTLSAPTLPSWLSFDASSGILSGTPTNAEVGSHSVVLRVNDGTVDVEQSFTIFVSDPNSPIVLALLPAADSIDLATQGEFFDLILNEDIQITQFNDTLIQVFEVQSQALVEKLDTDQVGILGNSLSFVLSATLTPNVEYEILVSANVIEDLSGNPFAGVTANQWRFTTINNLTVATDDNVQTNEDTSIQIDVLANDFDSDNLIVPSSTLVLDVPSFGLAQVNTANGVITYTPNANFNGQDSFTYQVSDTQAESSNIAVVTINVTAVNDAPTLQADVVQTTEDRMLAIDVLANDTDIDLGDSLDPNSIQIVQNPSHGSLNIVGSLIEYSPAQDFTGGDSFSYQAADSQGRFGTPVNVMINVLGENDIPVATDDVAQTTEDTSINIAVLANDFDIEDVAIQAANITLVKQANLASLTINLDGTINYQPQLNANGIDSFEYVVTDSEGAISAPAVVNVVISAVADSPVTNHDTVILAEDSSQLINVLGNDADVENDIDVTSIIITSTAASGVLSIEANGLVMYQPEADFFGSDSFSYSVMDDTGLVSNISVVSIQVTAVNDQPIANTDHYQTLEDTEILLNPADNDQDIDGQLDLTSLVIVSQPSLGVVTIQSNGQIRYQPNFNVFGTDSFSYQISDDQGLVSEIANVTIDITAVNDAPVFTSQAVSMVNEDELYSYLIQLTDIEQEILTLNSQLPDWLTLTNLDNFTYRLAGAPTEADVGNYDIQLILSDEEGLSDNQNFQISVLPVNDAPEIQQGESLALNVVEDQSISTRLSLFDSDSETFQWQILTPAQFGVVTVDQGLIQYNPNTNSEAPDSFVIELSDGELTDTIMVNVSVTAENDAPQILLADGTSPSRSSATSAEDTQLDVRLTAFDTDSSNLTWTLEQQATLGRVTIEQGLLTYQPLPDFVGSDSVRVLLSDGELSDSLTLSITVTSVNDAPVILLDDIVQLSLNEDENIELIYQAQDDNGVENLTWQVAQAPNLGLVLLDANGQGSGDSNSGISSVLNYQANPNSFGQDSFVLQVSDGELTDQVEVRLTLNPVNDSPIGEADEYSVNEAELLSVDLSNGVLTNDTDLDNDDSTLVAELVAQPSRASVFNFSSDGSFSYQHDGSDFGLDSFSYRVFDGVDFSQSIEVNLTILPVNDLPQFISSSPSESVQQGDFFNYDIGTFDPDDINLSLSYQGPDWLMLNGHNLSGVVPIEQTGAVSFTLTLQDASGGENTQTANFSIIERDIIQLEVTPSWSASPAFVDEKVVANIQLQSFSEQAETLQLNLTLSEGVSVIKSADCPFTGVTASCNIQVSLAEIQNIQIELLSAQAQDILLTANLVDQFNVSVGSVSTDVAVVKQAVNQGNASFDISNATAISAADIAENQGVEIIAGTELGDTIKIVTMSAAEEQASLLAEIDNTGQTEQVLIDDFDQNGELDIAIINSQGQSSDIYYWIAPLTYQTNPSTNQINFGTKGFIQDFNFDGLPDLAVTGNSFNLAIYINVDGVFSETPDVYTTDSLIVSALGLGVSNEIVVATKTNLQTLSYQISNQQQRPSNITGMSRRSVRTDIVSYASKVEKASFVPISEPLEIVGITDIAVADLDGDSSQDIVVTSRPEKNSNASTPAPVANNSVSIIATNRSKLTKVASFGSSATNKVSIADFDGDNKPDLMVGNDNGTVQIFKRGLANDNSYEAQESAIVASSPLIIPVDIDGDGLSDVISYDKEQGKVALFSTNSDGSLGQQVDIALSSQMTLTEVGFAQDSRIFYQLFVANLSQIQTQQNQVKLTPDEGVDVSQMPAYCQQQDSSDQIVCELGTLAKESTKQIPFMLSGEFSNRSLRARYNGAVADPNPDNNSVSNHFSQYSGNLAVRANLLASNNYQFNYQVSATNLHSSTLTNVKTKISFPLGLGYIQVPDNCVRQNSTLDVLFICQFGTLAAQQSADIDFELKSSAELNEQEIMIDVQGKSDVIDTDTSNNAAQTNLKGVFTAPSVSKSSGGSNSYSLLAYLFILFLIRFLIRFNYVACNRYVSTVGESK
ncbi:tandem-95 repeat protein, partial [Catenovulum maritimum]